MSTFYVCRLWSSNKNIAEFKIRRKRSMFLLGTPLANTKKPKLSLERSRSCLVATI